jgi:hypothetical protein
MNRKLNNLEKIMITLCVEKTMTTEAWKEWSVRMLRGLKHGTPVSRSDIDMLYYIAKHNHVI